MSAHVEDLRLALELADLADEITLARYGAGDLVVDTKPDLTPVTEADTAVERRLRERLDEVRGGDAIVGEEFGASEGSGPTPEAGVGEAWVGEAGGADAGPSDAGIGEAGGGEAARRWVIDPIDGTKNYVRGIPLWATLLALQEGEEVTVAVVSAPALGRRWWASRGGGAFVDAAETGAGGIESARRLRVSYIHELGAAQLSFAGLEDWQGDGRLEALLELVGQCWRTRSVGDFWAYMLVAEGAMDVAIDPVVSLWDLAAPQLIVEEAGGRFTDLAGVRTAEGGDAIATNGPLHDAALAIVGR